MYLEVKKKKKEKENSINRSEKKIFSNGDQFGFGMSRFDIFEEYGFILSKFI